ncbi:DNA-processing protein DprA [Sphingomonas turrisvirgatae]|uniref:DNA-processing protein DprA n=1 Tax=Sphingomonas turrisvirgatae TaxID=1888892 RepID=UPI0009A23686|nr:DNA-processing protein DprA [Sphingomonas turrisvirgatae]
MITHNAINILRLADLPGVGAVSLRRIIKHSAVTREIPSPDQMGLKAEANAQKDTEPPSARIIAKCVELGIGILTPLDGDYPAALRFIEDFPPILYYKGDVAALREVGAAVVGTRDASALGLSWARQISEVLASAGFTIVSGLALGIDTAAHEGALRGGGRTVAVLAHGLHQASPVSNKELAARIIAGGGAWISEHPPGTPPRRAEFVRRNRMQSGMSVCSIVVESGYEGGAIHQGNFTSKQGRKLFCVVPDPNVLHDKLFNLDGARRLMAEFKAEPLRNSGQLRKILDGHVLQDSFARFTQWPNKEAVLV